MFSVIVKESNVNFLLEVILSYYFFQQRAFKHLRICVNANVWTYKGNKSTMCFTFFTWFAQPRC